MKKLKTTGPDLCASLRRLTRLVKEKLSLPVPANLLILEIFNGLFKLLARRLGFLLLAPIHCGILLRR